MFLFLAGAFISSLIVSRIGRNQKFSYVLPIIIEVFILCSIAFSGSQYNGGLVAKEIFAGSLLFAMGMQNSLVSIVSGSVVRTTHLTGAFTDLRIVLAQIFSKKADDTKLIRSRISLRLAIIGFFMAGAVSGAYVTKVSFLSSSGKPPGIHANL